MEEKQRYELIIPLPVFCAFLTAGAEMRQVYQKALQL